MGDQLKHEFSLGGVPTGRITQSSEVTVPGASPIQVPGAPIMRPSFLQAFLANLGPALAGGLQPVEGQPFGTGLGGALGGIESHNEKMRQYTLQANAQHRLDVQAANEQAVQQAQLQKIQQETPLDVQAKQLGIQEQQLNLQMRKGVLDLANNPDAVKQVTEPMVASLGKMSADEQAQIDAAHGVFQSNLKQGKFDPTPIQAAVTKISQDRITTARGAEASPFKDWKSQFIQQNGREPNTKEIMGFVMAPRSIFAPENKIIPVADPNNPGAIIYQKAGQALAGGAQAPTSAVPMAAKSLIKSATSGPIANEINAFNTALAHASLLRKAAKALNNGDSRTLSGLVNRAQTEFGDPDLTNFNAIAGAYSREVTKMLSAGHMTDAEISSAGSTIPSNANYKTIDTVLKSYEDLAKSKLQQRQNQLEKGLKGQANFPAAEAPAQEIHYKIVNGQLVPQ